MPGCRTTSAMLPVYRSRPARRQGFSGVSDITRRRGRTTGGRRGNSTGIRRRGVTMTDTVTSDAAPVVYNPFAPGFVEDPYPHYAELRAADPVHQHPLGFWALWRHSDVSDLLRAKLSVEDRNAAPTPIRAAYEAIAGDRGRRGGGLSMLDRDPPDHTRLRRLVSQAFTPRTIEALEPRVQVLVDEALDRIDSAGEADLI